MPERDTQDRVTRYRAISTAEKRAQIEREGDEWPTCDCHGAPMYWLRDSRYRAGGYFFCSVRDAERKSRPEYLKRAAERKRKRYAFDPEHRASELERGKRLHRNYLRVRVAGMQFRYRVPLDKKQEIQERLAAFREDQARTRQEARENGWID